MKTILVTRLACCLAAAAVCSSTCAAAEEGKTPEAKAWEQVDSLNKQSLQDFVKKFPDGKYAQEAKLGCRLQDKFAAIRAKKSKPAATIPFDVLGQRWQSWTKEYPKRGVVGYFAKKDKKDEKLTNLGFFSPLTGGSTPGGNSVSFDGTGVMVSPTGDGSIIGFETDGLKYEWLGGVVFQGSGDEPMFFGVLEGTGLVHLSGAGKITVPDGKTFEFK
jgi:hypothetical protein